MRKKYRKYKQSFTSYKPYLFVISREIFQVTLLTYLLLLLIETLKAGFVSYFLDLNYLLVLLLVAGVTMVLTEVEGTKLNGAQATQRIWNKVFYSLSSKSKYADKYPILFTEIRARELVKMGGVMNYKDWYNYAKEQYLETWFEGDVPTTTRFDRMSYAKERNWQSFLGTLTGTKISKKDLLFILVVSIAGGFLVYYKTQDLGQIAPFIAILSSVIILLLSVLIYTENE